MPRPLPVVCRALAAALLLVAAAQAGAQEAVARSLAATCANCHGTEGRALGEMKPLAGMPAPTMLALLADFRSGARPATVMHQLAKGYTDAQLALIAGWFAAQKGAR